MSENANVRNNGHNAIFSYNTPADNPQGWGVKKGYANTQPSTPHTRLRTFGNWIARTPARWMSEISHITGTCE